MSSSSPPTFKHQLIQLQAEFTQYTRSQKSKGMPIQVSTSSIILASRDLDAEVSQDQAVQFIGAYEPDYCQ